MADQVLTRDGPVAVPMNYKVPQGGELMPLVVRATMDGTSAATAFYATVQIIAPSGRVMGSAISTAIAAGGSADVTWFPGEVAGAAPANPVASDQLDYVEITSSVNCSAGTQISPVVIIQGNPVSYDGNTRVRVEAFSPHYDLSAPTGGNFLVNLFLDSSNVGRFSVLNSDAANTDLGIPYYGVRYLTPPAGSHAFSIRGWTTTGSTVQFEAGQGGSSAETLPGYLRVSL